MRTKQLSYVALVAIFAGAPCSAVPAQDAPIGPVSKAASSLVVRGRVLSETAEPIPSVSKDIVGLASHWTYRLRVKHVIAGKERSSEIVAASDRDGALLRNTDFVFHLTRKPNGTYDLIKVDRVG